MKLAEFHVIIKWDVMIFSEEDIMYLNHVKGWALNILKNYDDRKQLHIFS